MTDNPQQTGSPIQISPSARPSSSSLDLISQLTSARGTPHPSPAPSVRTRSISSPFSSHTTRSARPQTSSGLTLATRIKTIDAAASQSIRAAHTILDAAGIVKELIENALDAHSSRIDVRLRGKAALDSIVVSDDGVGVARLDHETLCLPSTTSKLRAGSDFSTLSTFGFRGEALAAIRHVCASLTIITRARDDPSATSLTFAQDGSLARSAPAARPVGTTATVTRVFHALPVRRKNALANQAREIARCVAVVQALAIIATHTRIELRLGTDVKVSSSPFNLFSSRPLLTLTALQTTTRSVLGARVTGSLIEISGDITNVTVPTLLQSSSTEETEDDSDQSETRYSCIGLISKASLAADGSGGRARSSYHYMYINERPVDLPRVIRAANEVYRRATGLNSASPTLVVNFKLPPWSCDVNLAPDKRHVLIHDEDALVAGFVRLLERTWIPTTTASIPLQLTQSTLPKSLDPSSQLLPNSLTKLPAIVNSEKESPVPCSSSPSVDSVGDVPQGGDIGELSMRNVRIPVVSKTTPTHSTYPDGSARNISPDPVMKVLSFDASNDNFPEKYHNSGAVAMPPRRSKTPEPEAEIICFEDEKSSEELQPDESSPPSTTAKSPIVGKLAHQINDRPSLVPASTCKEFVSPVDFANLFRCDHGLKRRRSYEGEVSAETKLNSVQFASQKDAVKAMVKNKRVNDCPNRRSVLEYVGRRAKRVSSKQSEVNEDAHTSQRSAGYLDACILDADNKVIDAPENVDVTVVMDGSSPEVAPSQVEPVFIMDIDWDSICNSKENIELGCTSEGQKQEQHVEKNLFCKASITECAGEGEGPNHQQEAADRELSRLFRQEWFTQLRVIGQFNRGFIIGQLSKDLFIIDQHASDEKYNFEDMQRNTQLEKQRLVQPQDLEFSAEDELLVAQYSNALRAGGFDIRYDANQPPTHRLKLHAQPASKHTMFVESDLQDIVHLLRSGAVSANVDVLRPPRIRAMFATRACRKSIMIGTSLHRQEMYRVLRNMATIAHPWTCPHGRPTMRHLCTLPLDDIEF